MKWNVSLLLVASVIAGASTGCSKSEQPSSASAEGTSKAAAAKSDDTGSNAKSIPVDQFLTKIAPTTCTWLDQCKNEKIKAVTATMGMMIAGFGTMDKPELAAQVKTVGEGMKKENRHLPNKQECDTIGGVVMKVIGLTPDAVNAKVGKTLQYDGEKAAACLATLASPFAPCETEVKLTSEPKMSELESFEKEFKDQLDAHTKACEGVFAGLVEAGQACEYDFECKGEHSKCKSDANNPKAKSCQVKGGSYAYGSDSGRGAVRIELAVELVHVVDIGPDTPRGPFMVGVGHADIFTTYHTWEAGVRCLADVDAPLPGLHAVHDPVAHQLAFRKTPGGGVLDVGAHRSGVELPSEGP